MPILIQNATLINEGSRFKAELLIDKGKIAKLCKSKNSIPRSSELRVIDAEGLWLIPGIIDDQVHFRDPGLTHKADFHSETLAAAAGGVTSVMEMPNTLPQTTTQQHLFDKFKMASEKSLVNYSFYFGATNDNLDELLKTDPRKVCGIKIFMGASTGNMLVDNIKTLEKIFSQTPCLVAVHCEDEKTIQTNTEKYKKALGEDIPISYHPIIRSEEACYKSSSLAVKLAKKHQTRLHVLHLSTAKELSLFDNSIPLKEKKITAEVCIHHLWFSDQDYTRLGSLIKWNPAIKTAKDRAQLIKAVLNNTIDVIATDHAPHTLDEKSKTYFQAPSGGPLVQHSLVAMLELTDMISPEKVVEKMCHAPADLFNIDKRGYIREGYWADLVLVDPKAPWTVTKENLLYKCGWSPFEGQSFSSKVVSTFVNGNRVYHKGDHDESIKGKPLDFLPVS